MVGVCLDIFELGDEAGESAVGAEVEHELGSLAGTNLDSCHVVVLQTLLESTLFPVAGDPGLDFLGLRVQIGDGVGQIVGSLQQSHDRV